MSDMASDLARTWLFVPGDRPDRFDKAVASGADAVIIDLEDAVDAARKPAARAAAAAAVARGDFSVRVSSVGDDAGLRDLDALSSADARPAAVILAKAEDPDAVSKVVSALGCPVVPLVESAAGLEAAAELAAAEGVARLAFGAVDFSLDIDASPDPDVLAYARSRLVTVSRAHGIAAPLDTPSLAIADAAAVAAEAGLARRFGMGGKLCIHPAQVPVVAAAFRPTEREASEARRVLAAAEGDGAAALDGRMIDLPVLERARRVLARAEEGA